MFSQRLIGQKLLHACDWVSPCDVVTPGTRVSTASKRASNRCSSVSRNVRHPGGHTARGAPAHLLGLSAALARGLVVQAGLAAAAHRSVQPPRAESHAALRAAVPAERTEASRWRGCWQQVAAMRRALEGRPGEVIGIACASGASPHLLQAPHQSDSALFGPHPTRVSPRAIRRKR